MSHHPKDILARIAVVGSINIDIAVRSARLPKPGETLHGDSFALSLGGKGANQAAASARLGADVTFVGRIGTDMFGDLARQELARFGLAPAFITSDPGAGTGIATIGIDAAGENAITIVSGVNAHVSVADVHAAAYRLSGARALLLQCETPFAASIEAAGLVRASGGVVILDPAPAPREGIPKELLALVDLLTPNESEAMALTGITVNSRESGLAAARKLRETGARGVIIKLGAAGLIYATPEAAGFLPAFNVNAVDTVAAGDCFNAGLAVALGEGARISAALCFAAACGAVAVTRAGAADSAPTRPEAEALVSHGA